MPMEKETIIFYDEWLPLDKKEFRILAMLADKGEYRGTLSGLCDYFSVTRQHSNRERIRSSIQELNEQNYIVAELRGRTYTLRPLPKEKEIQMDRGLFESIRQHDYTREDVAWEQVIKLYLWIKQHDPEQITSNAEMAAVLNVSQPTVCAAKNVLEREYDTIRKKRIAEKTSEGSFRALGQIIEAGAWWETIK